jgi:hypothetical protein
MKIKTLEEIEEERDYKQVCEMENFLGEAIIKKVNNES